MWQSAHLETRSLMGWAINIYLPLPWEMNTNEETIISTKHQESQREKNGPPTVLWYTHWHRYTGFFVAYVVWHHMGMGLWAILNILSTLSSAQFFVWRSWTSHIHGTRNISSFSKKKRPFYVYINWTMKWLLVSEEPHPYQNCFKMHLYLDRRR